MDTAVNSERLIRGWITEEFRLPESALITVVGVISGKGGEYVDRTDITVSMGEKLTKTLSILKPPHQVEREDIGKAKIHAEKHLLERYPFLGQVLRFFGLWFAFSGLYSMFAVCPVCGQAGCPVGAGSVGLVGIIFAAGFQSVRFWLKGMGRMLKRFFGEKKKA